MAEKKPISAPGAAKKKPTAVPNKQTMNFVRHKSSINVGRLVIILLVIVVALAAITKFGILDQQAKKRAAAENLAIQQTLLDAVNQKMDGYADLEAQYGRYSYGWMNENERSLVGRLDVIDLLDKYIIPVATVENFSLGDNVLALNISGVTLEHASIIVKQLEGCDIVESASVYSASAEEAAEARIYMSVVLTKEAAAQ